MLLYSVIGYKLPLSLIDSSAIIYVHQRGKVISQRTSCSLYSGLDRWHIHTAAEFCNIRSTLTPTLNLDR